MANEHTLSIVINVPRALLLYAWDQDTWKYASGFLYMINYTRFQTITICTFGSSFHPCGTHWSIAKNTSRPRLLMDMRSMLSVFHSLLSRPIESREYLFVCATLDTFYDARNNWVDWAVVRCGTGEFTAQLTHICGLLSMILPIKWPAVERI